jgi:hypothetical protein
MQGGASKPGHFLAKRRKTPFNQRVFTKSRSESRFCELSVVGEAPGQKKTFAATDFVAYLTTGNEKGGVFGGFKRLVISDHSGNSQCVGFSQSYLDGSADSKTKNNEFSTGSVDLKKTLVQGSDLRVKALGVTTGAASSKKCFAIFYGEKSGESIKYYEGAHNFVGIPKPDLFADWSKDVSHVYLSNTDSFQKGTCKLTLFAGAGDKLEAVGTYSQEQIGQDRYIRKRF